MWRTCDGVVIEIGLSSEGLARGETRTTVAEVEKNMNLAVHREEYRGEAGLRNDD